MNAPFNIPALLASMEALLAAHPELADDETLRSDMLEGCTDVMEAMSVLAQWDDELSADIEVLKARKALLATRQSRKEKSKEVVRATMLKLAEASGIKSFKLPEATITLSAGQQSVEIIDPEDVPDEFCRIKREPNKTAIKDALKSGRAILGCVLANGEPTISVRRT